MGSSTSAKRFPIIAGLSGHSWCVLAAAGLSLAALFIGIQWGSFIAGGADSSAYVSQADLWRRGELVRARPEWMADAPWAKDRPTTPLGYTPGVDASTMVPVYSPGLPLMMAAFQAIGGEPAVYYVVPVLGALAVWATFLLGRELGGPITGLLAGTLLLVSPPFLHMLVQPMSDVPAAAAWAVALYFACRPGAAHAAMAGAAVSVATLIRPNLSPLAAIIGVLLMLSPERRLPRALLFGAAAVPGMIAIAVLNAQWYGSPTTSGYGPAGYLYSTDRVAPNLTKYPVWLIAAQTPAVLLAFASVLVWPRRRRAAVVITTILLPLAVLAFYLPYFVFHDWWYLRFLLPGYPGLLAGMAGVAVALATRVPHAWAGKAALAVGVCALAWHGVTYSDAPFGGIRRHDERFNRSVAHVKKLPADAIVFSLNDSGVIHHRTGREVLRWEAFSPPEIDAAVSYLRERGFELFLFGDTGEIDAFRAQFGGTRVVRDLEATPASLDEIRIYPLGGTELPAALRPASPDQTSSSAIDQ